MAFDSKPMAASRTPSLLRSHRLPNKASASQTQYCGRKWAKRSANQFQSPAKPISTASSPVADIPETANDRMRRVDGTEYIREKAAPVSQGGFFKPWN
jgi:hypothetical protein